MKFLFFWIGLLLLTSPCRAQTAQTQTLDFAILRGGVEIGHDVFVISRNDDAITADITTHIVARLLSIPVYRLDHHAHEEWQRGQLQSVTASTNDNGTQIDYSGVATEGGFVVHRGDKHMTLPSGLVPTSLWNIKMLTAAVLLDAKDGSEKKIKVMDFGQETISVHNQAILAHHYETSGAFEQDLWYDSSDTLVKVSFKASDLSTIDYVLR